THSWVFGEINLHLDVTKSTISTGNVLAKFGEPCFVSSSNGTVLLGWPNALFVVPVSAYLLEPSSRVGHIVLRHAKLVCPKPEPTDTLPFYEWRGFRSYP